MNHFVKDEQKRFLSVFVMAEPFRLKRCDDGDGFKLTGQRLKALIILQNSFVNMLSSVEKNTHSDVQNTSQSVT